MKNLRNKANILALLFFSIPFMAVLLNYFVLFVTNNRYLNGINNIFTSYLEDSTFLFFIQMVARICFLLVGILLTEALFKICGCFYGQIKFINITLFTGATIGISLAYFKVSLFVEHPFSWIETIVFYTFIGYIYGTLTKVHSA